MHLLAGGTTRKGLYDSPKPQSQEVAGVQHIYIYSLFYFILLQYSTD